MWRDFSHWQARTVDGIPAGVHFCKPADQAQPVKNICASVCFWKFFISQPVKTYPTFCAAAILEQWKDEMSAGYNFVWLKVAGSFDIFDDAA